MTIAVDWDIEIQTTNQQKKFGYLLIYRQQHQIKILAKFVFHNIYT